jgi:hypothetical protein
MPNLCGNRLTITGPEADVNTFVAGIVPNDNGEPCIVDAYLPFPHELKGEDNVFTDEGWAWTAENWGTKWGDYDTYLASYSPGEAVYHYTTAWTPMDRAIEKISTQFPTLQFVTEYEEEGNGLLGATAHRNGVTLDSQTLGNEEWPELKELPDGDFDWDGHHHAVEQLRTELVNDLYANLREVTS